jgi:PrgI family protein
MRARVPLDVDLEDKLIYGLTPTRFGYLVVAALAAFGSWTGMDAEEAVRGGVALLVLAAGACLAWGRTGGRPLDQVIADFLLYTKRNYRLARRRRRRVRVAITRPIHGVVEAVSELVPPTAAAPEAAEQLVAVLTGPAAMSLKAATSQWQELPAAERILLLDRLRRDHPASITQAPG